MDVVITGSSGLIGSALLPALEAAGHRPIRLVRRIPARGADEIQWDPANGELDAESLEGIDAVIHLAGAGIGDKRWTESYKQTLVESRTGGTSLLASALAGLTTPPKVFLSGSAIGYYGDQGDTVLTEASPPADDFLADLCVQWEAAAQSAIDAGITTTFLRTGIVQSPKGGALAKTLPLFKFFLGGKFGSGRQYSSWIHIDDIVAALIFLLDAEVAGPVNLTAPNPVTNTAYTEALGKVLGRPTLLTVPAFGPKLLLGGEMADALLFDSMRVMPTALADAGFEFRFTDVEAALRDLLA
ncbi:MAG: TIGR01777 family oxidoreductase [Acidimicrobiales bacterium]